MERVLVVEKVAALFSDPRLEEGLADRLRHLVEAPIHLVDVETGEGVLRGGDPHAFEDREGEVLPEEARILERIVEDEALVSRVLLGGDVLVEVDLEGRFLRASRARAARTYAHLPHGDAVQGDIGRVVVVGTESALQGHPIGGIDLDAHLVKTGLIEQRIDGGGGGGPGRGGPDGQNRQEKNCG